MSLASRVGNGDDTDHDRLPDRHLPDDISPNDVVIAISQSGETANTLAAIELAREKGAFVYGICNAVGSSIPRVTHTGSYIHVGPKIGVASTKAFTGQVTVLTMFTLAVNHDHLALFISSLIAPTAAKQEIHNWLNSMKLKADTEVNNSFVYFIHRP